MSIQVRRSNIKLTPKANRVLARYFDPGDDVRKKGIIEKILSLPDDEARFTLNRILTDYSMRHRNISKIFNNNFLNVEEIVARMEVDPSKLTREKQLLIGSYFTMEYSIESAAFFNPSIVEDPDQTGLEDGWLLLTHGVGSMRAYSIGATLLDLDDPSKVIGHLYEPLMRPNDDEREGYVPNVLYSCGAIIHNNELVMPYAMADYASSFAFVSLDDLLEKLTS